MLSRIVAGSLILGWLCIGPVQGAELRRAGFVGVSVAAPSAELRASLKLPTGGILVQGLVEGGGAKVSGVQPGDVIVAIDGRPAADVADFVASVRKLKAGDAAELEILRGTRRLNLKLRVKPRPQEHSPDAEVRYDAVSVDGALRRTIVTVPRQPRRHPAVLYLTGIGCFSQESLDLSSPEAKLLYGLTRAGFVTMRVEKGGVGDSEGTPCLDPAAGFAAETRGYLAGLKALKAYPFVDPERVFLVGLSIGGIQAPLVAEQVPVRGVVVINTVAKPFLEYLIDTRRRQALLHHIPYDKMERRLALNEVCNHRLLIEKQTPDQLLKASPDCKDFIDYPQPYTYMQQWAALNPAAEWKKVRAPVLVVYGEADYVSTIADDPYLADMINSFHPGNASLKAIPGMDHYLLRAASMEESMNRKPGAPSEFDSDVLDAVELWLQAQSHG